MLLASRMNCRRGAPSRFDMALAGGLAAAIALTGAQSQALAQTAPAEGWQFEASSYARLFGLDCLSLHALRYRGAGGHPPRAHYRDYSSGNFRWDMTVHGPLAGLRLVF